MEQKGPRVNLKGQTKRGESGKKTLDAGFEVVDGEPGRSPKKKKKALEKKKKKEEVGQGKQG